MISNTFEDKDVSPIARLSKKGYVMCPKKNINRETHKQNANNGVLMRSKGIYQENKGCVEDKINLVLDCKGNTQGGLE